MNNGKQSEQLLKVLGGHSASLDRTSKCRGLSEHPLYSGGHKAMQHETRNWNNFDKCFCVNFSINLDKVGNIDMGR